MATRPPTQAELEAAHWLEVLDAPNVPRLEIERFQAWLSASDENRRAYAALSATSDRLDAFLGSGDFPANDFYVDEDALARRKGGGARAFVLAASIAGFGLIATFAALNLAGPQGEIIAVPMRETRLVELDDGTILELSPGARTEISLREDARTVQLEDGVALFRVAHDGNRPFLVSTRFGEVRVTGTEFVVRIEDDRAIVSVLSGRVEGRRARLLPRRDPDAIAGAQQEFILGAAEVATIPLSPAALEQRIIWRERMVALDGQSLREAAHEIERFSGARFVFADRATEEIRLSGYVEGDDVDAFLALLASNVGVASQRRDDGAILLGPHS